MHIFEQAQKHGAMFMTRIIKLYNSVPNFMKTRYAMVVYAFAMWMCFFDANNLFYRLSIYNELREARHQKAYYQEELQDIKAELKQLFSNNESLERFAREKYYMKRPDEDVFVFVTADELKADK